MRTKGFCSALLRCGEIKLIAEKREFAISDLIAMREYRETEAAPNKWVNILVGVTGKG